MRSTFLSKLHVGTLVGWWRDPDATGCGAADYVGMVTARRDDDRDRFGAGCWITSWEATSRGSFKGYYAFDDSTRDRHMRILVP